jgi:hypothetical protein
MWIIEALVDGKYHIVHRFSPGKGSVKKIGQFLQNLQNMSLILCTELKNTEQANGANRK